MKKTSLLFAFLATAALLFSFQLFTERDHNPVLPFIKNGNGQWYKIKADAPRLTASELIENHKKDLGLGPQDEWVLYRTETDQLGMTHSRYQLHHQGLPVEGSELLVHEKEGFVVHFNGRWAEGVQASTQVGLTPEEAVSKGLEYVPAEQYIWNDPGAEALCKEVHRTPDASFYPSPKLVLYNAEYPREGGSFKATYQMIVQALVPHTRQLLLIDAQTGALLHQLELLHHTSVEGTAETYYHGTQQIVCDSIAPDSFRLFDATRGHGVWTLDLNESDSVENRVDFWDEDNYWNNVNADFDEVATDAHWSAEMTFDFFHHHLDHTGVDGDSMALVNLVHFSQNVVNAFWNGSFALYGDGDGNEWTPLTSLDVVGHEFTHGVTDHTANLIYQDEPGALNESFSDIFGAAVEFWGEPDSADYYVGEDFHAVGNGFRNMADPNEMNDPDTYLGNFWQTADFDNGGVHTNSGVQNYWFYLLAEGGTGTNDNGYDYEVEGIGVDIATLIAFRNLKYYLVRFSQYEDARYGARTAAEDLYGPCSFEARQTINAWQAVGVGGTSDDHDFEMIRLVSVDSLNCGLTASEFPTIEFRYNGCLAPLGVNDSIPLAIQIDNGPIFRDTIVLSQALQGGDTLIHTFATPIAGMETMGPAHPYCLD